MNSMAKTWTSPFILSLLLAFHLLSSCFAFSETSPSNVQHKAETVASVSISEQFKRRLEEIESSQAPLSSKYAKAEQLWRDIVDQNLTSHSLSENIFKMAETEKQLGFKLLLQSGAIRAKLFQECRETNCKPLLHLSDNLINDLLREVKIIPYRAYALIATKVKEINDLLSSGLEGWVLLIQQFFGLLVLVALPILFYFVAQGFSRKLESLRANLLHSSHLDYEKRTSISLWILRINPYLKWGLMYLFVEVAARIIDQSKLAELSILVSLLKIYFLFQLTKILLNSILTYLFQRGSLESYREKKAKISASAKRISLILFIEIVLLTLISDLVRKAIIYTLISSGIFYFNILFFLFEAKKWRSEIFSLAESTLPAPVMRILQKRKNGILSIIITPLLGFAAFASVVFEQILSWLSQYDFFKRIHSEIFKKRLEDVSKNNEAKPTQKIPEEYLRYFHLDGVCEEAAYIQRSQEGAAKIIHHIDSWKKGDIEEDGYVITGDKGLGKSVLIREVFDGLEMAGKHFIEVPPKITTSEGFFELLSRQIGHSLSSVEDMVAFDEKTKDHHVFLFDDAQNFFLGTPEGFEAYKVLLECVNLQTTKLFWLFTFNRRSWDHLQGIFGSDHIFGKTLTLRAWSDVEIQSLIIKRHKLTGFRLTFDRLISAFQSSTDHGGQIETQFFRLLWGQSRGNPRTALALWLSAISSMGQKEILVGIPEFSRIKELSDAGDDSLFVYAAILRHENISISELHHVTHLPEAVVKRAIRYGEDYGILYMKNKRVLIQPLAQHLVNSYLLGKNFIYE